MGKSAVLVSVKLKDLVEQFPQKAYIKVSKRWLEDMGFELVDADTKKEKIEVNAKNYLTSQSSDSSIETSSEPKQPFGAFGSID